MNLVSKKWRSKEWKDLQELKVEIVNKLIHGVVKLQVVEVVNFQVVEVVAMQIASNNKICKMNFLF